MGVALQTAILLSAAWPFSTDDAYITLRYSRHLVEGHGVVWNVGEPPIEGYSNFLYVILGALALKFGMEPMTCFKWLGVISLGFCGIAMFQYARLRVGRFAALVPVLLMLGLKGTVLWTVSGLETPAFLALGFLALNFWARSDAELPRVKRRYRVLFGLSVFFACLCRPDGALIVLTTALCSAGRTWHKSKGRGTAFFLRQLRSETVGFVLFGVLFGAYLVAKVLYFDRWLPNTVICKSGFRGSPWVLIRPFLEFGVPLGAIGLVGPWREFGWKLGALIVLPLTYCAALYGVDPIIGYENRHFLLPIASLSVGAVISADRWLRQISRKLNDAHRGGILLLGILLWQGPALAKQDELSGHASHYALRGKARFALRSWLDQHMGQEDQVVLGDVGAIAYELPHHVVDAFCLNNLDMARLPPSARTARFVTQLFRAPPEWVVVHSSSRKHLTPRPEYDVYPTLLANPQFFLQYELRTVVGAPGDDFQYWVFRHRRPT